MGAPQAAVPRRCPPASPLLCSPHHLPAAAPSFYSPTSSLQPRRYPSAMSSLCSQGITLQPRRSISTPDRFSHNKPASPMTRRLSPAGHLQVADQPVRQTASRLPHVPPSCPNRPAPPRSSLFRHFFLSSSDLAARDWLPRTLAFTLSPNTPPSPLITTHTLACTHDSPHRDSRLYPVPRRRHRHRNRHRDRTGTGPGPDQAQKNARTTQGAGVGITE